MMHFLRLSEVPVAVFQPDAPELAGAGGATCTAFAVSGFIDLIGHFDEGISRTFKPSSRKPLSSGGPAVQNFVPAGT
jgi:hypothetical protein